MNMNTSLMESLLSSGRLLDTGFTKSSDGQRVSCPQVLIVVSCSGSVSCWGGAGGGTAGAATRVWSVWERQGQRQRFVRGGGRGRGGQIGRTSTHDGMRHRLQKMGISRMRRKAAGEMTVTKIMGARMMRLVNSHGGKTTQVRSPQTRASYGVLHVPWTEQIRRIVNPRVSSVVKQAWYDSSVTWKRNVTTRSFTYDQFEEREYSDKSIEGAADMNHPQSMRSVQDVFDETHNRKRRANLRNNPERERSRALAIAQRMVCSTSSRGLYQHLVDKKITSVIANDVVMILKGGKVGRDGEKAGVSGRWISDDTIACSLASAKWRNSYWSPQKTRYYLKRKLFEDCHIDRALSSVYGSQDESIEYDTDEGNSIENDHHLRRESYGFNDREFEEDDQKLTQIVEACTKRYKLSNENIRYDGMKKRNYDEEIRLRRRICSWLAYRGHSGSLIHKVIDRIFDT